MAKKAVKEEKSILIQSFLSAAIFCAPQEIPDRFLKSVI